MYTARFNTKELHIFSYALNFFFFAKGKFAPVRTLKAYKGSGDTAPHVINFITRWKWLLSFTSRPINPQENDSR